MRVDDLLYLAVGAVPGAVIGGRLGQLAIVPEAFAGGPLTLLDPAIGGLELGLGVVGGVLSAAYVGRLLGAPVGRWATTLAVPLLIAIGGGKLAMAVGGSGQGLPLEAAWSTAYLGTGPWGSLAPALPSHPAQLYEGFATLILALVLVVGGIGSGSGSRRRPAPADRARRLGGDPGRGVRHVARPRRARAVPGRGRARGRDRGRRGHRARWRHAVVEPADARSGGRGRWRGRPVVARSGDAHPVLRGPRTRGQWRERSIVKGTAPDARTTRIHP